ncbi:hypothetical protein [Kribbella sp. C-35]|uniref:hypothetical protein n=1 Tax=Kribbella sp. C-35 TaxID=2789276 RepID=UPI00397DA302
MYAVHDGSSVINANGFCMVGGWTPLRVDTAIESFRRYDALTRLWGLPTAVPFAVDYTGCLLAVRPSGTGGVLDCFDDSPPSENAYVDIEDLLAQTAAGLRGEHPQYRCELTPDYLLWIDRDLEKEDLVRRR